MPHHLASALSVLWQQDKPANLPRYINVAPGDREPMHAGGARTPSRPFENKRRCWNHLFLQRIYFKPFCAQARQLNHQFDRNIAICRCARKVSKCSTQADQNTRCFTTE